MYKETYLGMMINESIYYIPKSEFDDKNDKYKKNNKLIIQTQNQQMSLII